MGLWHTLNRPLPLAAWRRRYLAPPARALATVVRTVWRLAVRPLPLLGLRPSATAMLTWNVAWSILYLAAAGGTAFWALRTDDFGHRLRSVARLEAAVPPVWLDIQNAAYAQTMPARSMPLPAGDPGPTLEKLLAYDTVQWAFYISPGHQLTVRERYLDRTLRPVPLFRQRMYTEDLATWRPDPTAALPPPGPWTGELKRAWQERRAHDRTVAALRECYRSLAAAPGLTYPSFLVAHAGSSAVYVQVGRHGEVLGYLPWGGTSDLVQAALYRTGLQGRIGQARTYTSKDLLFAPDISLPLGLQGLQLVAREDGLAWADEVGNREDLPWVGLLLLLALVRAGCASRDLKAILDERAIALAQSDFVSAVSHEMRTPLTTIQLYAEMLSQDVVTEPARRQHYLDTIASESQRLGRLIENVLDYARISGRRKAYRFEPLDVRDLLSEALAAVRGPLEAAGLEVELHAPVPLISAVDRDALVQALINLLGNAAKYAADGKRVLVSALPRGNEVQLTVQDFGPGIAADEQQEVFKAFYRVGNELTRTTTGSGLGLALVEETAKAHGGRVELKSAPGLGSAFRLVLPGAAQQPNEG